MGLSGVVGAETERRFARGCGGVVGVVGALDAAAATWFGDRAEFWHLINAMPFVPARGVTDALLGRPFVARVEWPGLVALVGARAAAGAVAAAGDHDGRDAHDGGDGIARLVDAPWRGLLWQLRAIADPDAAWRGVAAALDDGTLGVLDSGSSLIGLFLFG